MRAVAAPASLLKFAAFGTGLAASLTACAPRAATPATAPAPVAAAVSDSAASLRLPSAIRWTRLSAEHRAAYIAAYRNAGEELARLAAGHGAGSWGVILDADETVLDNSEAELDDARAGRGYSDSAWVAWVRRAAAPALPGAVEFLQRVHALGGRVVIVTNRADSLCDVTRQNIQRVGLQTDAVLCQPGRQSDKNPRFQAVAAGAAGLPPLDVLMWVGDNIQDFPKLQQRTMRAAPDSAFAEFGHRFIILPNAMYGSWDRIPAPPTP